MGYELGQKMSAAGREGTFTTWMLQESDLIQMAARGYGDNLIAERFGQLLEKVFTLYCTAVIERNLPWFIISKTLPKESGEKIKALNRQLCAELGTQALAICDSFAITDTMLSAPIALDWVQYNSYDNQGELMSKQEWDTNVM